MRRALAILVFMSAGAYTAAARADTTAAQALFEEGRRLMQAGDYAAACPKLAESQRLDPGAGTLLNLAACYEKREQLASAWVTYTEAASDADRSNRPEWVKKGREKASALQPILTTLTIVIAPDARTTAGLQVFRDGKPIASAEYGVKVPIDGGDHVVEARAPGYESWITHVTAPAKNGALSVTVLGLVQARASAAPATSPDNTHGPRGLRIVGGGLAIAGVVGLGLGGLFTSLAVSKHNEAKGNCTPDETLCNRTGLQQYDEAGDLANLATASFIAGGILLAGGVVLYLLAPSSSGVRSTALRPAGLRWTF